MQTGGFENLIHGFSAAQRFAEVLLAEQGKAITSTEKETKQ